MGTSQVVDPSICEKVPMRVSNKEILNEYLQKHSDLRATINAWYVEAQDARWQSPSDIKDRYPSASILPDNCIVFNLKGNRYRLLVRIAYKYSQIHILKIGTHAEYDRWEL